MSVAFKNRIAHSSSENVLGLLPGSTHPDEVVVYSAHWDHFGKDPGLEGDQIYNGAIDNGTGIAGLLEIAEAFAHQDPPPQRSILFIADTLEDYFTSGACDGFIITPTVFPRMFEEFCRLVVPELQKRGLYRTTAQSGTFRSRLRADRSDRLPQSAYGASFRFE